MGRGFTVQAFTKAYWGTGSVTTGVAAAVTGTVVNDLVRPSAAETRHIRIAHPSGTIDVDIDVARRADGTFEVKRAALLRTARKLMEGTVFVPLERVMTSQAAT